MSHTPKSQEEEDREKSPSIPDRSYESHPPSGPQHSYGKGGVGLTQRRLTARHVTFIGFGGGIGTGLFIGTGSALASAGPAGLLLAYVVVGAILWCVMECLGEMATFVSTPPWNTIICRRQAVTDYQDPASRDISTLCHAIRRPRFGIHPGHLLWILLHHSYRFGSVGRRRPRGTSMGGSQTTC
jgi:hypothetical protein